MRSRKGWHSRGYLPHFDGEHVTQGVTFRLADSLPKAVLELWQTELQPYTPEDRRNELHTRINAWLDAGHGECLLKQPDLAQIVQNSLLFFDAERYQLLNWCVMPNHVHVLFNLLPGHELSGIVHSWKSFTAKAINKALGRTGQVWMPDYFDRYIRDHAHFQRAMVYIDNNPVKAGLCGKPEDWLWCGACVRTQSDS